MRVLHAFNQHRGRGGADHAAENTVRMSLEQGIDAHAFRRDSRDLPGGMRGKLTAAVGGIYARGAVKEFQRELERLRPDLVHVHELYPMISPWILPRCSEVGVPVVMSCSDYRLTCPVTTHFRSGAICTRCLGGKNHWAFLSNCRGNLLESASYALFASVRRRFRLFERHVARFIMPSDFARRWFVDGLGLAQERFATVYPPISIPAEPVDPGQGGYVAYAGRFAEVKGVPVLLSAMRRLDMPLWLAGDADHLEGVEASDALRFVMTKRPDELARFYRGARMLVVPSIWNETFGAVAAEALSHGVPVVAARMGALPELVEDGETGLLFEAGDADQLAERIQALWSDPDLARRLGSAGRERVRERCRAARHIADLEAVYTQTLRESAS